MDHHKISLGGSFAKDTSSLRFDTQDDALDFARQSVEHGRRWVRQRGFSCTKDYLKNRARIDISGCSLPEARKFKLVVQFVPFVDANRKSAFPRCDGPGLLASYNLRPAAAQRYAQNTLVFVWTGEGAKRIEQVVPSIVRLECPDKDYKFGVNILATCRNFIIKIFKRLTKGEVDPLRIWSTQQHGTIADCLIERVSKVVYYARGRDSHLGRNAMMETKLDDLLSGIRITVVDDVISAVLDKSIAGRFEINDACFCPIDE